MDALVQRSIEQVRATAKSEVPWTQDEPWHQTYHTYQDDGWKACNPQERTTPTQREPLTSISLYTWNIDFMLPFPSSRLRKAITHLQKLISADSATIVFLQECLVSDLALLASDPWIQTTFHLTDLNASNWSSGHYGTVTLIDRRLYVGTCFRVHYSQTRMERDALFTDVVLGNDKIVLRFCNTHLESLALEPALRPKQVALAARYLHEEGLAGGVMAGDFNAIQSSDRNLHSDNGLKDAYIEVGGEEDSESGYTWGQQAATKLREQFGCSRMDKVFFVGDGLQLKGFEQFGADVEVDDPRERDEIVKLGFDRPWVTDHLGVVGKFEVLPKAQGGEPKM